MRAHGTPQDATGQHTSGPSDQDIEAASRRAVACMKACTDIPTERLEAMAKGERVESLEDTAYVYYARAERDALRQQKEGLLGALRNIANPEWGPSEWQPLARAMTREARVAIQEAEGR